MADEKDDLMNFSFDQLKSLAKESAEEGVRSNPPQEQSPPSNKPTGSWIDEADSVLSDIMSTVNRDVRREEESFQQERVQAEEDKRRVDETMEAQRQKELQDRIALEQERQRLVEEERLRESKRLAGEDEEPEGADSDSEFSFDAPVTERAESPLPQPSQPDQGNTKNTRFYLLVIGLPILALTAIAVTLLSPQPQAPTKSKVEAPKVQTAPKSIPLPTAEPNTPVEKVVPPSAPASLSGQDQLPSTHADKEKKVTGAASTSKGRKSRTVRKKGKKKRGSTGSRKSNSSKKKSKNKARKSKTKKRSKPKKKLKLQLGDDELTF